MANIGRPSDYIKTLEAHEIITRDMRLYTSLELHTNINLIEKDFLDQCELRRDYKEDSTNQNYFKEIEYTIELYIDYLIKNNDKLFNNIKKNATKDIIKDEEQLKYLYFLLYSYCNTSSNTPITKQDVYINNFSTFEHIKNKIKNYLEQSKKDSLETFNTTQLLSNKNANQLKSGLIMTDLYDDNINEIFSHYVNYSLLHNEGLSLKNDTCYLQIDLSSQDEEILRVIKLARKELNIKKREKHKAIRDGLSLGEKRANMLFAYDCMALGLSNIYIKQQIEYYCERKTRNFTLSDNKLEDYTKELKTLI